MFRLLLCMVSLIALSTKPVWADSTFMVFEDPSRQLTVFDIENNSQWFKPSDRSSIGLTDSVFWLEVELENPFSYTSNLVVNFDSLKIEEIEEFTISPDGIQIRQAGYNTEIGLRPLEFPQVVFPHEMPAYSSKTLLYRVSSAHKIDLAYSVVQQTRFVALLANQTLVQFSLAAVLIVLLLYNGLLMLLVKSRLYGALTLFLLAALLYFVAATRLYERADFTADTLRLEAFTGACLFAALVHFVRSALALRSNRIANLASRVIYLLCAIHATLAVSNPQLSAMLLVYVSVWLGLLCFAAINYAALQENSPNVAISTVGVSFFGFAALTYAANLAGLNGVGFENALAYGSVGESLILSLISAAKLRRLGTTEKLLCKLREANTQLNLFTEHHHMAFWTLNLTTNRITYDDNFAKDWGLPKGSEIDLFLHYQNVSSDIRERLEHGIATVVETKRDFTLLITAPQTRWKGRKFQITLAPSLNAEGDLSAIVAMRSDVTELVDAQLRAEANAEELTRLFNEVEDQRTKLTDALSSSEASLRRERALRMENSALLRKFEHISEAAGITYFTYDIKTSRLVYGKSFAKRWDLEVGGSIRYQDYCAFTPRPTRDLLTKLIMQAIKTATTQAESFTTTLDEDLGKSFRFVVSPVQSDTTAVHALNVITLDITEAETARAALELKNQELEALHKKRDQMFGMVAHELRTPVAAIAMMVSDTSEAEWARMKPEVMRSSRDLLHTIDDMRLLINPDTKRPVRQESFRIVELNAQLSSGVASIVAATGMQYKQLNAVPAQWADQTFETDTYRVRHAISNLIKNACLHSQGSEVALLSHLYFDGQGGRFIEWIIRDNGVGITDDTLSRLFSAGERGDSKSEGSGFGLYIARSWIEEIGGDVGYRNCEIDGSGSEFFVRIPVLELQASKTYRDKTTDTRRQSSSLCLARLNVLYVEDETMLRMLGERLLNRIVNSVDTAKNGYEGLSAWKSEHDIVLTDYFMPEMTGVEMTRRLRKQGYTGPIIGVTAATIGSQRDELLTAGVDLVIPKPLTAEAFQHAVDELLHDGRLTSPNHRSKET